MPSKTAEEDINFEATFTQRLFLPFHYAIFPSTASIKTNIGNFSETMCRFLLTIETTKTFRRKIAYKARNWTITLQTQNFSHCLF